MRLFKCHVREEFPWIPHVLTDAGGNVEDRGQRIVRVVNCIHDAALVDFPPFKPVSSLLSGHLFE